MPSIHGTPGTVSEDYGAQNAPVAKYGNVSVIIGDTTKLTRKIERLDVYKRQLS